jgi:hypothetical protein
MEYGRREGKVDFCVIKHHSRKGYGKMEVQIHGFLISAFDGVPQLLSLQRKHPPPPIAMAHENPFGSCGVEKKFLAFAET